MHSIALRQAILLELETAGMRGPVRRRDVAEAVYHKAHGSELWALADEREAKMDYLIRAVAVLQAEPMSEEYIDQYLPRLPQRYRQTLSKMPTWICVSASGLHIMAITAKASDWAANARLKRNIADAVMIRADQASDIARILLAEGANSIRDLAEPVIA